MIGGSGCEQVAPEIGDTTPESNMMEMQPPLSKYTNTSNTSFSFKTKSVQNIKIVDYTWKLQTFHIVKIVFISGILEKFGSKNSLYGQNFLGFH